MTATLVAFGVFVSEAVGNSEVVEAPLDARYRASM